MRSKYDIMSIAQACACGSLNNAKKDTETLVDVI